MQKNVDDANALPNKRLSSNRQSHWTSLLSLFHSSTMPSQQAQQQQQQLHPTSITSRHNVPSSMSSTGVQSSSMSRAFSSELNLSSTSSLQAFDADIETDRRDLESRQRQRQQQADSALDRLNRLVAVDIEPPSLPLSNGDQQDGDKFDDSESAGTVGGQGRTDVSQCVPPMVAVYIDSRKYEINSARSSSSSAASGYSRSVSGGSDASASKVFIPRPHLTRNTDSSATDMRTNRTTAAVIDITEASVNERLVVDDESNQSTSSTRTSVSSHAGTSTGSSSSRSKTTSTAKCRIVNDVSTTQRSSSSNTVDDASADRKCLDSESAEHRGGLSSEQVDDCSRYRESSVCI